MYSPHSPLLIVSVIGGATIPIAAALDLSGNEQGMVAAMELLGARIGQGEPEGEGDSKVFRRSRDASIMACSHVSRPAKAWLNLICKGKGEALSFSRPNSVTCSIT